MINLMDALSEYAHITWSGWMNYMFNKSIRNEDGSITIPKELVERWTRQMNTNYYSLPENEQNSDKDEARKILEIVGLNE